VLPPVAYDGVWLRQARGALVAEARAGSLVLDAHAVVRATSKPTTEVAQRGRGRDTL
jgi:hypothetical protein